MDCGEPDDSRARRDSRRNRHLTASRPERQPVGRWRRRRRRDDHRGRRKPRPARRPLGHELARERLLLDGHPGRTRRPRPLGHLRGAARLAERHDDDPGHDDHRLPRRRRDHDRRRTEFRLGHDRRCRGRIDHARQADNLRTQRRRRGQPCRRVDHLPGHGAAAGSLRGRPRPALWHRERAVAHVGLGAVRHGPRAERAPDLGGDDPVVLRLTADRLDARVRREHLRGAVQQGEVSVQGRGGPSLQDDRHPHLLDVGCAPVPEQPDGRHVVLPRSRDRLQPPDRRAADGLVRSGEARRHEAEALDRSAAEAQVQGRRQVGPPDRLGRWPTPISLFALELAELADSLSLPRFRAADLEVETKPDRSPVTDADRAVERALRERIAAERPGETVYGEEEGDDGGAVRWIVDPIDGTRNFSRGLPVWATLIALERDGAGRVRRRLCSGARSPLVGGAGRGSVARLRAHPRLRCHVAGRRSGFVQSCRAISRSSRRACGTHAASAISGSTCSLPKAHSTPRSTRGSPSGTTPPSQIVVEEAGGRAGTLGRRRREAGRAARVDERPRARRGARAIARSLRRRGLVHRVAREAVELVGEHVARLRRVAGWIRNRLAVERDAFEPLRVDVLEHDIRPVEARAQPAGEQVRLRRRTVHAKRSDVRDVRPERREDRAPP